MPKRFDHHLLGFLNRRLCAVILAWCCLETLAGSAAAIAQTVEPAKATPPATAKTHPNDPTIWNADQMMEDAVHQIARRYDLNKAQEEFTRFLLRRRVLAFLETHEDDVRQLLKESIDFRLGAKEGTVDAYRDWAGRAGPVYQAARKAILDGNMEWREILTDKQKVLHDQDLDQMQTSFEQVSRVLKGWEEGTGNRWPTRRTAQGDKAQRTVGQVTSRPAVATRQFPEDNWSMYVETFISTYQLDEKQQNAARAGIHKEMHAQARAYRDKRKAEFAKIEAGLNSLPKETAKAKARREALVRQKEKLDRPIQGMFVAMTRRLDRLPRAAQRTNADAGHKKELDRLYKELAGDSDVKRRPTQAVKKRPEGPPAVAGKTTPVSQPAEPEGTPPAKTQTPKQPAQKAGREASSTSGQEPVSDEATEGSTPPPAQKPPTSEPKP